MRCFTFAVPYQLIPSFIAVYLFCFWKKKKENERWKMKNEKWKMKKKWKMQNEKWKMKSEKWKVEDGRWKKWRLKDEKWKMKKGDGKDGSWKMKNEKWKRETGKMGVIFRPFDVIYICQLQMPKADGLTASLMSRPHPYGACILEVHLDGLSEKAAHKLSRAKHPATTMGRRREHHECSPTDPEKYLQPANARQVN